MEFMVIEVHGVPLIPPHDRMVDHLKIHFMKRRNHGGDLLTVIYPTSTPGQAYVVFESAEVPGVLEWSHILDVDNRFYPVRVKKAHLSEVDMPVETALDLNMFPDHGNVFRRLKYYGFDITGRVSDRLQLKGSFLRLKALRYDLMQLQRSHEHPSQRRSPSTLQNGFSLGYETERHGLDPRFVSKDMHTMDVVGQHHLLDSAPPFPSSYRDSGSGESPKSLHSIYYSSTGSPRHTVVTDSTNTNPVLMSQQKTLGSEMLSRRRSPIGDVPSSSSSSSSLKNSSPSMQQHTSYRDSASGGSLSIQVDTQASSTSSSPSSTSGGRTSFQEETDILNFIFSQKPDAIKSIEKKYGTEMVLKDHAGLTEVTFFGKNSKQAEIHLVDIIKKLTPFLRTQKIHLQDYSPSKQDLILQRIQHHKDSGVAITNNDDIVKLVGSSTDSYEVMQKILEPIDGSSRGRLMERGSRSRRSSSLPRHYKVKDHKSITVPESQAGAAKIYSPSRYQEGSDEGKAQIVRSPEQTRDKSSQRTHSNSEPRGKNRANKEQAIRQDTDLATPSQGKNSIKQSNIDHRKLADLKRTVFSNPLQKLKSNFSSRKPD